MSQNRQINWLSDPTDRRVVHIRQVMLQKLQQQSKNEINYYDFLLVAKKLNFRFQESTHLMELRKFFFSHKNVINNKTLTQLIAVDEETIKGSRSDHSQDKIIIRFMIEGRIEAIQEVTNQDEDMIDSDQESVAPYGKSTQIEPPTSPTEGQEYQEKLTIILSIKVTEMMKKIKILIEGLYTQDQRIVNLISIFEDLIIDNLPYEVFKKGAVGLIRSLERQFSRDKLTMSQEDIKAIFTILDVENKGQITKKSLMQLLDEATIARKVTRLYETRINSKMVKNTLFKLGRNSNSIQIYHVKNASVLEFKSIQEDLLQKNKSREKILKRIPHFGPIKGSGFRAYNSKAVINRQHQRQNHTSLTTYKHPESNNLDRERQKIEQIIKSSKQQKKRSGNDTIANKLRKLFIHKVILPRQKLLEEQKMKYAQSKANSSRLIVKLI